MLTHTIQTEADKAVAEAKASLDTTYRLGYHIMAPANWINDPNGLIHYKDEYHVFYQHHPYDENWGPMHWGHVKSKDLVHWEHLPIALAPTEEYERDGCFSGSAVDDDGVLTLIYTGNIFIDKEKDILDQSQCIATSTDGIHFEKHPQNPVIPMHPEDGSGHFRDPKVWKHEGNWYMVLGTRKGDIGKAILYKSADLKAWQYLGVLGESDGTEGYMWECPDFFELDGEHVLLFSPQGMKPEGDRYQNLFQTGYVTGSFDYETNTFERGDFQELDHGHDFYAVQTLLDDKGRRIAIGWMDMWESEMPTKAHGWAGALTLPRVLTRMEDGRIKMEPVEELKALRSKRMDVQMTTIEETEIVTDVAEELLEIEVEFSLRGVTADTFGIKLRRSEDGLEETVIRFSPQTRQLTLDRTKSGTGVDGIRTAEVEVEGDVLQLRIFLDRSSVEVFANGGTTVMTSRIYPDPTSLGLSFYAEDGSVDVKTCNVWQLKDVWTEQ